MIHLNAEWEGAFLTSTEVYRVSHGETGIAFTGTNINKIILNQDHGFIVEGSNGAG